MPIVKQASGRHPYVWTHSMVVLLREYWRDGRPAQDIADHINQVLATTITREAVISKARNLGLGRHPSLGAGRA